MLGFLEKFTLAPGEVTAVDVQALRRAGIRDQAVRDALYINAYFHIINRLADALDVFVPPPEVFTQGADYLLDRGYVQLTNDGESNAKL